MADVETADLHSRPTVTFGLMDTKVAREFTSKEVRVQGRVNVRIVD